MRYWGVYGLILSLAMLAGCRPDPVAEIKPTAQTLAGDSIPSIEIGPDDWPWWRGPTLDNHATGPTPPLIWSEMENLRWKVKIPGDGHSSPIVVGDKVFVTYADAARQRKALLAVDRESGEILWDTEIHKGGFMTAHSKNSQASSTPASDGHQVYVAFMAHGGIQVTAVDFEGDLQWQKEAGPFASQHGYGSSLVLYESTVIVAGDSSGPGFLAALRRDNGDFVWRVSRPQSPSYGTPIVATVAGRPQLFLSGQGQTRSYDPRTGEVLWYCDGPATTTANTVAFHDDYVFATGGYPQNGILCIQADGEGDVTTTHVKWKTRDRLYVPTPLIHSGKLWAAGDSGIGVSFDLETGDAAPKKRLGGSFSASLTLSGNHMFVPDESGSMRVFELGDSFKEVANNKLSGNGFASPVICGGRLYSRTSTHLYCIGE